MTSVGSGEGGGPYKVSEEEVSIGNLVKAITYILNQNSVIKKLMCKVESLSHKFHEPALRYYSVVR